MISLLKYPYPYKAALAINNDTDGMSWETFRDWHDFVNGRSETRYGQGLGLEVSDSFWHWTDGRRFALYHNHPEDAPQRSPEYDYIAEMAKAGWLDMLHGFGSWNRPYTLSRSEMIPALEEMDRQGIRPPIYVNHGGGAHMAHNIGGPWASYQQGDDPSSPSYCLDLLLDHGFRYFWTDSMFESGKFGDGSTWKTDRHRNNALASYDYKRFTNARLADRSANLKVICNALGVNTESEIREAVFDNLFIPTTMRDGRRVLGFKRFRGEYPPDAGSFAHQINAARLDDLIEREAVAVIYQHFGIWRAIGSPRKDWRSWRQSRVPVLDEHCQWAFRFLAEREQRGDIFITTTARLLDYIHTRDHVAFRERRLSKDTLQVLLLSVHCPVYGSSAVTEANAQGLSFDIPDAPEKIVVTDTNGNDLGANRHSAEGSTIVTVPWQRLSYPPLMGSPA